jgi:hypothetical protein
MNLIKIIIAVLSVVTILGCAPGVGADIGTGPTIGVSIGG